MLSDTVIAPNIYVEYSTVWGPGRRAVFNEFRKGDWTDQEVAIRLGMKPKTVSARRVELWRDGYLEPISMRRMIRQRARVWSLTELGRKVSSLA